MEEKDRLSRWMEKRNFSINEMATAIGDSYSNVYMIVRNERPVGDAFKYRFILSFGVDEAVSVFDDLAEAVRSGRVKTPSVMA